MFNQFYFRLHRKYVVLFGNLFNNITLARYQDNQTLTTKIESIKVPILYGPKEHWVTRLQTDPDANKATQVTLPRMSFEITGRRYNTAAVQNQLLQSASASTATSMNTQYIGVPYDIEFQLQIYVKNIDDGNQIVEQILPNFRPDFTISALVIPELNIRKDIPIILNSADENITYEGDTDTVRYVIWTLNFTMKAYFFGGINDSKIIRKVIVNLWQDNKLLPSHITKINMSTGNGIFQMDDTAYQGNNASIASATGFILKWDANNHILHLTQIQGTFLPNSVIRGTSTNAAWTISSFDSSPTLLQNITIEPNPITAEPDDDYGYSVTVTEFPNTLD